MGTRNLTCAIVDHEYKIAQYGQWDGRPDGQGATALAFVQNMLSLDNEEQFRAKCNALKFVDDTELKRRWHWAGVTPTAIGATSEMCNKFNARWPGLDDRDVGAKILEMVYSGDAPEVYDSVTFAAVSLFCEWAYVIDMDHRQFETYRGFVTTLEEFPSRFSSMYDGEKYYPVAHVKTYSFDKLPSVDEFVQEITDLTTDPEDL